MSEFEVAEIGGLRVYRERGNIILSCGSGSTKAWQCEKCIPGKNKGCYFSGKNKDEIGNLYDQAPKTKKKI